MHKFALVCSIISLVICEIKYSNTDLRLHVSKKLTTESEVIKIISPGQLKPGLSSIDWRESGCVTPVKDQGFICHACWTFSAVAGIEAYYSLKYQRNLSLSEQQLIDCSVHSALGNRGCLGGSQGQAYMYVKDWGIETDDSYPYQEYHRHEGIYQCRANLTNSVAFVSGYYRLRPKDEETMKDFVSSIGPIIIAFDGSLYTFLNYEGGIYEDPDCSSGLSHSALVIGYGVVKDENGTEIPYWLCKNSWSENWGENGFFRIIRGKNMCGLTNYLIAPIVN